MKLIQYAPGEKFIEGHPVFYHLFLSERNILSLLTKLYTPESARTLETDYILKGKGDREPSSVVNLKGHIAVTIEADKDHYTEGQRKGNPPGQMHPHTQRILDMIKEVGSPLGTQGAQKAEEN